MVALYDVGENYMVMELLEGESLADRIARGPLPLTEVLKARPYDVGPDGRFVVPHDGSSFGVPQLNFIANWFEDVRRPTGTAR